MRDQKAAVRGPRIGPEATVATDLRQVLAVQNLEEEAEPLLHFALPLLQHRWRRGDDDGADLPPGEQFAEDQAGLDGLAESGVIRDEEVDAREPQRTAAGAAVFRRASGTLSSGNHTLHPPR